MAILVGGLAPFPGTNNHLVGTDERDIVFGDPFTRGNLFGVLVGDAVLSSGTGGHDRLDGRAGVDDLIGDAWQLSGSGRGGDDTLVAGRDDDSLAGDAGGAMTGHSRGGDDTMDGGSGDDFLFADTAVLHQQTRGGDDILIGGRGDDQMWGDAAELDPGARVGADRFTFAPGSGLDVIFDFEQGKDRLDVRAYGISAAQFGQHVQGNVVDFDRTAADVDEVTVSALGGAPVALAVGDFIFA